MKNSINDIINNIIEDNYKAVRKGLNATVQQVERDFLTQGNIYLDNYYAEYDPEYYNPRTDNLRNNSLQTYRAYKNKIVEVGIKFSAENMEAYPRSKKHPWEPKTFATLEDYVLYNAMEGFHGWDGLHNGAKINEEMKRYTQWYSDTVVDGLLHNNIAKFI